METFTREELERMTPDELDELENNLRLEKENEEYLKNESSLHKIGRVAAQVPKNIAKGVAGVGDILLSPVGAAVHIAGHKLPSMAEGIEKNLDYLTEGFTKERTPNERILGAAVEGVSSMGPLGIASKGIKAASSLSKPAKSVLGKISKGIKDFVGSTLGAGSKYTAQNITGNAATSATIQKLIEEGYTPEESIGMVLGTSAALPIGKGIINPKIAFRKGLKKVVNEDVLEDFKESGIQPTLGEVIPSLRKTQQAAHAIFPSPGNKVFNKRSSEAKDILGIEEKPLSQSEFGESILNIAKKRKEKKSKEASDLFEAVPVDREELVNIDNMIDFLENSKKSHLSKNDKVRFDESYAGKILDKLIEDKKEFGGKIPVGTLKDYLTDMNDAAKGTHGQISTKYQGLLKAAIEKGKKDLDIHINSLGEEASAAQKKANDYYSEYMKEKPILNDITKISYKMSEFPDLSKRLISDIKAGRTDRLKILKDSVQDGESKSLNSSILYELGRSKNGEFFNPHKFSTNFEALDPKVKSLLTDHMPTKSGKNKLKELLSTINASKDLANEANFSGTAPHEFLYSLLQNPKFLGVSGATGTTGAVSAGLEGLAAAAATLGVTYGGAKAMASPKTISMLHRVLKSSPKTNLSVNLSKMSKSDNEGIKKIGKIARKVYLDSVKENSKSSSLKKNISRGVFQSKIHSEDKE